MGSNTKSSKSKDKKILGLIGCCSKKMSRKEIIETEVNMLLKKHKNIIKPEPFVASFGQQNRVARFAIENKEEPRSIRAKSE